MRIITVLRFLYVIAVRLRDWYGAGFLRFLQSRLLITEHNKMVINGKK